MARRPHNQYKTLVITLTNSGRKYAVQLERDKNSRQKRKKDGTKYDKEE
jgi:hypothetical protein